MNSPHPASGARRARFPKDVPQLTELVDLCFAGVLDYSSRRNLQDIRAVAERGEAVWRLSHLVGIVPPDEWALGSVRDEAGRIVGTVTITRRTPERGAWLISNVAVHPDFRRRGIARELVRHALDVIRTEGGSSVYLQVDAANESAARMYREIGFRDIGGRIVWLRPREAKEMPQPPALDGDFYLASKRKSSEWIEEYSLWRDINPHGAAWNTPLMKKAFRPSLWKDLELVLTGGTEKHFLARSGARVEAALSAFNHFSGWEGVLIQRKGTGGQVERGLLDAAWTVFPREKGVLLETTPEVSAEILIQLGFQKRRTFLWMRYTFDGGVL